MAEKYDIIGKGYNDTRKADPAIVDRMWDHLGLEAGNQCLDIGCGTGNYTLAFQRRGLHMIGVEPSLHMLNIAQSRSVEVDWRHGQSEAIPLGDASVEGAVAMLTLHHWTDLAKGFQEVHRVLKPGGKWVILTASAAQMRGYWLNHYFPAMLQKSIDQMPDLNLITKLLKTSGFSDLQLAPYLIPPNQIDLFLYAGKERPRLYLDARVRKGISSFADLALQAEVEQGLKQLEADIDSGEIDNVMAQYAHEEGDYLFVVGTG